MFSLPPLDLVYKNCIDLGYPSLNILSVTRINKKSAEMIKKHINSSEKFNNSSVQEIVNNPAFKELVDRLKPEEKKKEGVS